MMTVDERDDQYPFGNRPVNTTLGKSADPIQEVPPHPRLKRILEKLIREGASGETSKLHAQEVKRDREELLSLMLAAQHRRHTAGLDFWQGEFRGQLAEHLQSEFDTVFRETLPEHMEVDPNKPPAPIRFAEDWDNHAPYARARKLSPEAGEHCRQQLQELLDLGIIQPSASPFGAPVMMVPKPGAPGKMRMVVDYRALNDITIADKFPLPDVQGIMDRLQGKKDFHHF
jgi:hypothetical protein